MKYSVARSPIPSDPENYLWERDGVLFLLAIVPDLGLKIVQDVGKTADASAILIRVSTMRTAIAWPSITEMRKDLQDNYTCVRRPITLHPPAN